MKTAISLPDATFVAVTERARELGVSRSEFFALAARRYLDELDRASLTEALNQVLCAVGDDESTAAAVTHGRRRLAAEPDW